MWRGILVALLLGVGVWYMRQPHTYEECMLKYHTSDANYFTAGKYCQKQFRRPKKPLPWRVQ